jgi:hypothetical protein
MQLLPNPWVRERPSSYPRSVTASCEAVCDGPLPRGGRKVALAQLEPMRKSP